MRKVEKNQQTKSGVLQMIRLGIGGHMRGIIVYISLFVFVVAANADETSTGIPLDTQWKQQIYDFALKNVKHPAWGIAHSERNYQLTKTLAAAEHIALDLDVLFASAFLHD